MTPGGEHEEDESRADVSGEIRLPATLEAAGPVPQRTEIAIIGGGVMGLSIAYSLACRGLYDVVVLERGYLAEGASGRNGGGVRQQWSTEINIRLMQESVELCRRFAVDLGVNVWFRQGGYLFLARTEREVARLEKNIELQNRFGVATRHVDEQVVKIPLSPPIRGRGLEPGRVRIVRVHTSPSMPTPDRMGGTWPNFK